MYHAGAQPTETTRHRLLLHDFGHQHALLHAPETPTPPDPFRGLGHHFQGRRLWFAGGTAAFLLIIGIWFAVGPWLVKAQVGAQSISLGQNDKAISSQLQKQVDNYILPVKYTDGNEETFALSDVGFSLETKQTVAGIRAEQHGTLQRFMWWRPIEQPVKLKADNHKLHDFIAAHITKTVQPSQDAMLTIENGEVVAKDGTTGKQYGLDNPQASLLHHAASLVKKPVQIQTLKTNPAITAEQLTGSKAQLEKVLSQPVSLTIADKVVKPSKTDIASWLELTPNVKAKTVDVDINSGKVQEYISKIAKTNVRTARDQVEVTRDDGSVEVIVPGVNGVDVTNKDQVATQISDNLLAGKGLQASMPINTTPFKTLSTAAYPKWIEVDITNKRMYAYEQTTQVKSFLVSAGAPKTPTVTGKFTIYSKYAQKDMRGNNVDGTKYFQPHVPWVAFFHKDYAIHGNYWRPTSYFGRINSSHGCVSTVPSEAAWIYDWAPIGTPVIVHT